MERGVLVPDNVTVQMVEEWVDRHENGGGFLLDGFPRTVYQAEALDRKLAGTGGIDRALYIDVSEEELVPRLSGRLICRDCHTPYHLSVAPPKSSGRCDRCGAELYQRDDDGPEAVKKRIEVYLKETEPLVRYYRRAGKLREVNGEKSIDEVRKALMAALE
jgi:adenylate kinase